MSADFSRQFSDYYASAQDIVLRLSSNSMPVDQSQTNTAIIHRDPCSASRLAWKNRSMTFELDNLGQKSCKALPCCVAIHCKVEAPGCWNKRNGAHLIRQWIR